MDGIEIAKAITPVEQLHQLREQMDGKAQKCRQEAESLRLSAHNQGVDAQFLDAQAEAAELAVRRCDEELNQPQQTEVRAGVSAG